METSSGIVFLKTDTLIAVIKRIEAHFPGWWWSVSQQEDKMTVSVGPGRNCPFPCDNAFALTKQGDAGIIASLPLHSERYLYPSLILNWIDEIYHSVKNIRKLGPENFDCHAVYRKQNEDDLHYLFDQYDKFIKDTPRILENEYHIKELYLGSCDLSVDCSLRGTCPTGAFDITIDLTASDVNLGTSLTYTLTELKADILTYIWNKQGD